MAPGSQRVEGNDGRVGESCGGRARHPWSGMAELLGPGGGGGCAQCRSRDPSQTSSGRSRRNNERKHDNGPGAEPPGRNTKCRKATSRTARLLGGPSGSLRGRYYQLKTGALPRGTATALGEGSPYRPVLVVPVPLADARPPFQGVSGTEDTAEDPLSRGAEGDWEVQEPAEDPGPPSRWVVQSGGAGFISSADVGSWCRLRKRCTREARR